MASNNIKKITIIKEFLVSKLILFVALACEVISYLMDQGIMQGSERVINGLTMAGIVLVFIYLVMYGLTRKYKQYKEKWYSDSADGDFGENAEQTVESQDNG
ncbi:MAG: hypothetical protein GXY80_02165 [Syntrophorhabdus aromaticivorans]|uniref:Uncharacterized protein n=1 Tax=Syntrophorhabdus aromaticivorans TaxID=328301 RepID=A0A971M261_9BACT|nr:hypothetical protein [Syntrophorhabdus aromaticivorans]